MNTSHRSSHRVNRRTEFSQAGARYFRQPANDSLRFSRYQRTVLSPRDLAVIASLRQVRLMTGQQLARLHYVDVSVRERQRALARLAERRLIRRLPRTIGGLRAGSAGHLFALDVAGQRLTNGTGPAGGYRVMRPWLPGDAFLLHTLAVAEVFVRLTEATRQGELHLAEFQGEPRCWRRFAGPGGGPVTLKPDAAVRLTGERYEDRWFLELDRSTQSLAVLTRKCAVYRSYYASGREVSLGEVHPRTLFVVMDAARYRAVMDVLGRQPAEHWALFAVCLFSDAVDRLAQGADQ